MTGQPALRADWVLWRLAAECAHRTPAGVRLASDNRNATTSVRRSVARLKRATMLHVPFLSLGLLVPSLGHAQPVPVAPIAASAETDGLVSILIPDAAMLTAADQMFDAMWRQQQDIALYQQYPGLRAFVGDKVLAAMQDSFRGELPTLHRSLAASLSANLDPAEIRTISVFFSSSIGRRIYSTVFSAIASDPLANQNKVGETAVHDLMQNLSPDDERALAAFGSSSAANKMGVVQELTAREIATWSNALSMKLTPHTTAVAARAIADFLASEKRPTGQP